MHFVVCPLMCAWNLWHDIDDFDCFTLMQPVLPLGKYVISSFSGYCSMFVTR